MRHKLTHSKAVLMRQKVSDPIRDITLVAAWYPTSCIICSELSTCSVPVRKRRFDVTAAFLVFKHLQQG
jgi:hypothetical protein